MTNKQTLYKHISKDDKHRHFKHELGLVASEPKGGVSDAYREGWERIFGSASKEIPQDDREEKTGHTE